MTNLKGMGMDYLIPFVMIKLLSEFGVKISVNSYLSFLCGS